ncbi:hypothetical protein [Scytonema sp. UIC 10036]|nr:hypothetical protein [Scytonema sp. UIC 10036]
MKLRERERLHRVQRTGRTQENDNQQSTIPQGQFTRRYINDNLD